MRALQWRGRRDVGLVDVPTPRPGSDEVLLDVAWCGICGTDVKEYAEGPIVLPVGEPNRSTGRQAPLTLGHEFAGRVRQLGSSVSGLEVGDRVAVEVCLACGTCPYCRAGSPALCSDWAAYGLHADGGMAEAVAVLGSQCLRLPPGIDDRAATLVEPTECAVRAVAKLDVRAGDPALVLGGGTIGLLVAQVLLAARASPVLVVSAQDRALDIAGDVGAVAIDRRDTAWRDEARARCDGLGAVLVVEAQGERSSVHEAVRAARKGGQVVIVGLYPGDVPLDMVDLVVGEKRVVGSVQHEMGDLKAALELIEAGSVRTEPLVTREVGLSSAADDAFEVLASRSSDDIKVLVNTRA